MSEPLPAPEPIRVPEKLAPFTPLLGLQGRLIMGEKALFADKSVELTIDKLSPESLDKTLKLMNASSERERAQAGLTLPEWKTRTIAEIRKIPSSALGEHHGEFFTKMGIDAAHFDDAAAQKLYEKYFQKSQKGTSIDVFLAEVREVFTGSDGRIDSASLKEHLDALQWMAGMFGADHSELITQFVDATIEVQQNPSTFAEVRREKVNDLSAHERYLLSRLTEGLTKPEPLRDEPEDPVVIETDPIVAITEEEINKLAKLSNKPELVSLGKDKDGKDVNVHMGFPDKKDARGSIIFPSEPYVFMADVLSISDKKHNEALNKVCVIAGHGIRTADGAWSFLNQQEIYKTVFTYNEYAKQNGLPPIEFIMSCNSPNQAHFNVISINTGDGTIVQSDHASINVSLYQELDTGVNHAVASYRDGEFIGLDELIKRKKRI